MTVITNILHVLLKIIFIKGASEVILPKCKFYIDKHGHKNIISDKQKIMEMISKYTKGMRIITLAYSDMKSINSYIFVGIY